jgi:actin-like ATPase involved in cell morphogenesis
MGTILLEEDRPTDVVNADLSDMSAEEAALMAQPSDLSDEEKRRILAVVRAVNLGNYFDLLQIPRTSSRRELKRAYFQLSKQFHPDRYYGRNLAGFKPVLDRIFAAISQFVKTLSDSRTMTGSFDTPTGPKRRRMARFSISLSARIHCQSWRSSQQALSQDLSEGGAFLVTDNPADVGEKIEVLLDDPSGRALRLEGNVVSRRSPEEARKQGRRPGLGVRFGSLPTTDRQRLLSLLSIARDSAPEFSKQTLKPRRRLARGTGPAFRRDPIIGIDLGTTNTSVAVALGDRVQILKWPGGTYSIPSIVAFPERGRCVVGNEAKKLMLRNPRNVIASAKRLLGRHADENELAGYLNDAQFQHTEGPDQQIIARFWNESYAIPQICSYLFSSAREVAEKHLEMPVGRAVVTVPVSFNEERVALIKRAAKLAHLDVVEVIEEPSAAALANRNDRNFGGVVGVYDFGGGTFDFSLVDASAGDLRVLTTTGDSWLGGDDFDLAIAEASADLFWRAHGMDIRQRAVEWQYLVYSCERAKRQLSGETKAQIIVPEVLRNQKGAFDLRINLSREKVEPLWATPIKRSIDTCLQALALVGMHSSQLSAIYLSGGTSYIPLIHRSLARRFGVPVQVGVPPEFAVCAGAGVHAAQLERAMATSLPAVG